MTKDELLTIRIPSDTKAALRRAAEADDRSVSSMVLRIVREWLRAHDPITSQKMRGMRARARTPRRASKNVD
jgi:uncharacterized protein (DUF1778 family)